ncbi:hypothetical protein [Streptomyces sp. NPDC050535]|uniref:hypothetical protein n=1 Tax=Streptomyces sp. NPDC050535 TaxID=3365626 RepID=UPI0037AC3C01
MVGVHIPIVTRQPPRHRTRLAFAFELAFGFGFAFELAVVMSCPHANGAAYADAMPVYAALGWDELRAGGPRCHGGYFGSSLNFEVDQR